MLTIKIAQTALWAFLTLMVGLPLTLVLRARGGPLGGFTEPLWASPRRIQPGLPQSWHH